MGWNYDLQKDSYIKRLSKYANTFTYANIFTISGKILEEIKQQKSAASGKLGPAQSLLWNIYRLPLCFYFLQIRIKFVTLVTNLCYHSSITASCKYINRQTKQDINIFSNYGTLDAYTNQV